MKIVIIGTGYVGLVTGACLSETGANVTCIDNDKSKIKNLDKGIIPIFEPGLDALVRKNLEKKRLFFSQSLEESLPGADAVFIAVGTPSDEDGSADLKYVSQVAKEIGRHLLEYTVVITKSTVPVGTAKIVKDLISKEIAKRNLQIEFDVASNPEFLKEGNAIEDFMKPDRIVIGIESDRAERIFNSIYRPFILNGHPIIFMDIISAELTKYAANAMLATKISFINEIANLCEFVGADIQNVRKGITSDTRIGNKFLYPGVGFGGSCFPKDLRALIGTGQKFGYQMRILEAVDIVNNKQKNILFEKINKYFKGCLENKTVAIWGLAFKPETDDMREAPSLNLIYQLRSAGVKVKAYDPVAMEAAGRILDNDIVFTKDMYEAVMDADALAIVTEWNEFRSPDFAYLRKLMIRELIFDGRNIYDPAELANEGFEYIVIGRD